VQGEEEEEMEGNGGERKEWEGTPVCFFLNFL